MQITDPVADMLTRIRNANSAKHEAVDVPASNLKKAIAQILLDEGYIKAYNVVDNGNQGVIHITLKYLGKKQAALSGLRRVSKPGLRVYAGADELPRVLKGLGIAMKNIHDRMIGYFGTESHMDVESALGEGTRVRLYLKDALIED